MAETPNGAHARHRATRLIDALIHRQLEPKPSGPEELVLCAMEFEALRNESELSGFLTGFQSRFSFESGEFVSWSVAGRIERRELSVFTRLCAKDLDFEGVQWPLVLQDVRSHLAQWYPFDSPVAVGDRIQEVLKDAQCLWCAVLPNPLAFHQLGICELTLLPDSCWQRRKARVVTPQTSAKPLADSTCEIEEKVIEVLHSPSSTQSENWVIKQLEGICDGLTGPGIRRTNATVWNELTRKLNLLARDVETPRAALLIGWALDIMRFGSLRLADPAIKTLANYLKAGSMPLFTALGAADHPMALTGDDWEGLSDKLLATASDPLLAPALASFHRYLVREHGIAPRPGYIRISCDVRTPRSNIIWDHEFAALRFELDRQTSDPRARQQLQVWWALFGNTSLRISELAGLCLRDVQVTETAIFIHVTSKGRTSLKSDAATRTLEIRDAEAREIVARWIDRRRAEAHTREELLFGDPYSPRQVCLFAHCYVAFSRALKVVTGDEEVSVHVTRHTHLSFRSEVCLLRIVDGINEPNPLEVLRCDAGHARVETTFTTYAHLAENATRHAMDAYLRPKLKRSSDLARWTGAKPETIRQRRLRAKEWDPWLALQAALPTEPEQALATQVQGSPVLHVELVPTFGLVLKVAGDWLDGRTIAATASRCGLSESNVEQAIEAIARVCRGICATRGTKGLNDRNWRAWVADECDFRRLAQARWQRAARVITGNEWLQHLQRWPSICARGGIDVVDHTSGSLLAFLHGSGFGPEHFVVKATTTDRARAARLAFRSTFGVLPAAEVVAPRRGRSESYALLLTTDEAGARVVPGKASDMKALVALVLAASAFASIKEMESA